ncbi:MAG: aminopeptidase P family protein [Ruminococcaceae bacterium]|nr:aminopeptidase P family protein [Oscillospiraceae bacterium]
MNKRIEKLLKVMSDKNLDNILITNPKNMYYLADFYQGEGYLIIGKAGLILATDSRYTEYANSNCKDFEVRDITKTKVTDFITHGQALGFEDEFVTYAYYKNLSEKVSCLVGASDLIRDLREVKDETEIEYIKKAVAISDMAFSHICSYMKEGMTEKEVSAEIDCFMKKNGAQDSSFSTIVAAGERGSLPHAIASDRPLKKGDLVVMDFGAVYMGYMSDMTRTVAIGDIDDEKRKIYETVLKAQKDATLAIREGVRACDVDRVARDYIDSLYPDSFGHSLGHSVGLDIHESPNLSPKNQKELKKGNVVTVEPGIYIPGFCGVRIEDMVIVGDKKAEILTGSSKELIYVG